MIHRKKSSAKAIRIFFLLSYASQLCCVSIVYNMRIAAPPTARQELYTKLGVTLPSIIVMSYVHQSRTTKKGAEQKVNAGLADYIYSFKDFYVRVDAAVGQTHEESATRRTKHTQVDDILLYAGYRQTATPKLNIAYSFLLGIPTHKDHGFEYFQFGTGHVAAGAQTDGVYTFGKHGAHSMIMALRFLHFFKSETIVPLPTQRICVDFNLGNIFDIFIAYHKKIKTHHFEVGYNPSFAFSVSAKPSLGEALPSYGIRNAYYAAYRYLFIVKKHPMGFSAGVSYSSDAAPKDVGLKRVISCWGVYGINF